MKSLFRNHAVLAILLVAPVITNCSKARYEQIRDQGPRILVRTTPEAHGTVTTRPVPPSSTPRTNPNPGTGPGTGETEVDPSPTPKKLPIKIVVPDQNEPVVVKPTATPIQTPAKDKDWMDPGRYDREKDPVVAPPVNPGPAPIPVPVPAPTAAPTASPVVPTPVQKPCTNCFKSDWTQPQSAATDKLDILFVIDTSESIFKEREAAAQHIDQLIKGLPKNVDYNIGVVLAHGPSTGFDGELYVSPDREAAVLKSSEMDFNSIRNGLRSKLTKFHGDRLSDGGELGLLSLMRSMDDTKIDRNGRSTSVRNFNLGMFRYDAGLAVIFIADENDICSRGSYPKGITPKADPNHDEIPAAKKYCKGITPESVYAKILQVKSPNNSPTNVYGIRQTYVKPVLVSALVYTNPATVPSNPKIEKWASENEVGYGYIDMVRLNNGVAIDLANADVASALNRIGQMTSQKLNFKTEFSIKTPGRVDPQTICVLVDGKEVKHRYDVRTNQIQISEVGEVNSRVEFFYCADNEGAQPSTGKYQTMQIDSRCEGLRKRFGR